MDYRKEASRVNKAAKEAFDRAAALVKEGKLEEARAVELLPSDRRIIERRIDVYDNRTEGK